MARSSINRKNSLYILHKISSRVKSCKKDEILRNMPVLISDNRISHFSIALGILQYTGKLYFKSFKKYK